MLQLFGKVGKYMGEFSSVFHIIKYLFLFCKEAEKQASVALGIVDKPTTD